MAANDYSHLKPTPPIDPGFWERLNDPDWWFLRARGLWDEENHCRRESPLARASREVSEQQDAMTENVEEPA